MGARKIRGRLHYFGPWADSGSALDNYLKQKDAFQGCKDPCPDAAAATVQAACNAFLIARKGLEDASEPSPRTWAEYRKASDPLVREFGKGRLVDDLGPEDFAALRKKMAKRGGPVRLPDACRRA